MAKIINTGVLNTHRKYHIICDECFCEFITEDSSVVDKEIWIVCPMCKKTHKIPFDTLKKMFIHDFITKKEAEVPHSYLGFFEIEPNNTYEKRIIEEIKKQNHE